MVQHLLGEEILLNFSASEVDDAVVHTRQEKNEFKTRKLELRIIMN